MELLQELTQIRDAYQLDENVVEYLSTITAALKTKPTEKLFDKESPIVRIDQLSSIVAALKILSDHDHRSLMTKDDIGINPNSSHQMLGWMNSFPKSGKGTPKLTIDVISELRRQKPKTFKNEFEHLKGLKDEKTRKKLASELDRFTEKVREMYNRVKKISSGDEDD